MQTTDVAPRPQAAFYLHLLTLLAAGVALVTEAPKLWFDLDEWDFLAHRGVTLGNNGIFYPHNEQWSTIPILIWRGIFNLVGVRDYWLYSLPTIIAHLLVVYLVWRLMLRHGVEPWTATLLAAAFAFIGVGWQDLIWAFQLGFVGSVAFGLLAIEAVEAGRRLWLPAIWCVCALMCSDIGIPMVAACGLVALANRKPKLAAYSVGPPAAVFLLWYVAVGHNGATSDFQNLHPGTLASYVWTGLTSSTGGFLDASTSVGAVVVIILLGVAIARRNVPAALTFSVVIFYAFVALGRLQLGAAQAAASRYSYVAIALFLPLAGQLITDLTKAAFLRVIILALLVLLVVANYDVLHRSEEGRQYYLAINGQHVQMNAAAYLLSQGNRFPGRYPAGSQCSTIGTLVCVTQDVPTLSTLASWVHHGQFPVLQTVPPVFLDAERVVLGISASPQRGYRGNLAFSPASSPACASLGAGETAVANLDTSGSLRLVTAHKSIVTVTLPGNPAEPRLAVVVLAKRADQWLNIPAGPYASADVSASSAVQLCEASAP